MVPHHLTHELGGADQVMGTVPATPLALVHRDAAGRSQIANPTIATEIDNMGSRDAAILIETLARALADAMHAAITTPPIHGSSVAAAINTLIHRDAAGRAQIVDPAVAADIDNLGARNAAIAAAIAATVLDDLADVIDTAAVEGDMLYFDQVSGTWMVGARANLAELFANLTILNDLADVTIAGLADGHFLSYSGGLGHWQNRLLADTDIPAAIARDAEVVAAIVAHAALTGAHHDRSKIVDPTDQDTLVEAEEDQVTMDVAGVEAFKLSSVGILSVLKQSGCGLYRNVSDAKVKTGTNTRVPFNTELFDHQNEATIVSQGTATAGTTGTDLYDSSNPFVEGDVGKPVWNHTDGGCTTIATYENAGYVTLTADIDLDSGDTYEYGHPRFTATEDGTYVIGTQATYASVSDGKRLITYIKKNGVHIASGQEITGAASCAGAATLGTVQMDANDYIDIDTYHNEGGTEGLRNGPQWTYMQIGKSA